MKTKISIALSSLVLLASFGFAQSVSASCSLQTLKECDREGLVSVIKEFIKYKQLNNRADLVKFKATEIISNTGDSAEFWTQAHCPGSGTEYAYEFNYYRYNLGSCESGEIGSHGGCPTCAMSKVKLVRASTCDNDTFNYYKFGDGKIFIETSYFNESEKYKLDCKICRIGIFGKGLSQVTEDINCEEVFFKDDYNFDGYTDLAIKTDDARNDSYDIYLYDQKTNLFIRNAELSDLLNVSVDSSKKRIYSGYRGGTSGEEEEYEYVEGKLKLVKSCYAEGGKYTCHTYDVGAKEVLGKSNAEDKNVILIKKYYQDIIEKKFEEAFIVYDDGVDFSEFKNWNSHFVSADISDINKNQDGSYKFRVSLLHDEYGVYVYENVFKVENGKMIAISSYSISEERKSSNGLMAYSKRSELRGSHEGYVSLIKDGKEIIIEKNEFEGPESISYFDIYFSPGNNYLTYREKGHEIGSFKIYNISTGEILAREFDTATGQIINNEKNLLVCASSDIGDIYYGSIYDLPSLNAVYNMPNNKGNECIYDKDSNIVTFYFSELYSWEDGYDPRKKVVRYDLNSRKVIK